MERTGRPYEEVEEEPENRKGRNEENASNLRRKGTRATENVARREKDEKDEQGRSGNEQRLHTPIGESEAGNYPRKRCHPAHVDGFRIYVPNATASQYVVHPTTGCRNAHVRLIIQKPYRRP